MDTIKKNGGLKIKNLDTSTEIVKLNMTPDTDEMIKNCGKADVLIFLTKSTKTEENCIITKNLLKEDGHVITLQNGMGNKEILEKYFNKENIIVGVTYQGSNITNLGVVGNFK